MRRATERGDSAADRSGEAELDRERHATITRLFALVCDLPPEHRRARLREACPTDESLIAEVERLLAAESRPMLDVPALGEGFRLPGTDRSQREDRRDGQRRFGPFQVRRCISSGGMAVVYEAEQTRPHRIVALKVLRGGSLSKTALRRFHLEAEVLGRLRHPGIARIYDAGFQRDDLDPASGESLAYIAMELIDGLAITDYADANGLDSRARMELLAKVCDAVQHAHQHGIIHRDLKPANILVERQGEPRVLDFGIARANASDVPGATAHTEAGQLVGTLPYMSPEQVLGDPAAVDARTDVYALGILLYELLAGRMPYPVAEASIPEIARIIREVEPTPLEAIDRRLRGDPAIIVATALEKDKQRRYQSAAQLAADIRHYLADEPILARPASTMYQIGKLARRNRAAVAALAVGVLALAAATVVSSVMAVRAGRAEAKAVSALRESEAASGYLLDLFMENPDQRSISRQELLEMAERRLVERPVRDPRVEANLREYIAHGWHKLNYLDNAEPHLSRALELRASIGARDLDLSQCLLLLAMQRLTQGRVEEGRRALREVLAIRRELFGPDHWVGERERELMYWTMLYAPEEPEANAELARRGLLRELAPRTPTGTLDAPLVLHEEFDADALDPAWRVSLTAASDWTFALAQSRLSVSDIRVPPATGDSPSVFPANVRLRRRLERSLSDFRVEARIGWDSEGHVEALQYATILLHGPGGVSIASAQYGDDWLQSRGARKASIGRYGLAHRVVNSGQDTLPDRGEAALAIERVGGQITITWDGHVLMHGLSSDPLAEVEVQFLWTVHRGGHVESSFGSEWIESLRVSGRE